jgi:hypothetical protein
MDDDLWLGEVWARVDERDRAMYAKRLASHTLHEIGGQHGLTRERVRQRLISVDKQVANAADVACPDWRERLTRFASEPAVSTRVAAAALAVGESDAVSVLLRAAGFTAPRVWGHVVGPNWWTAMPGALDAVFADMAAAAPLRPDELNQLVLLEQLPQDLPLSELLADSRSPLIQGAGGSWLRRSGRSRDAAYLWMAEHGSPCRAEDLTAVLGDIRPQALREALRRDERFAQIRPEGTWVLTEWSHPGVTPYSSAVEAMVAVLEEEGAISKDHLFARVIARYPVTAWRLQQCLLSDRIGLTPDGLVDLVARGAEPIEEAEPTRPKTMVVDAAGNVFGVRITVDNDVLRGSGILVNSWLTWKLGLRLAPMSKTFAVIDSDEVLTIRRGTSGAQISSLRMHAQTLGTVCGCQLAILLRVDSSTVRIIHACSNGECPALAK